jgi:hypothetical protein
MEGHAVRHVPRREVVGALGAGDLGLQFVVMEVADVLLGDPEHAGEPGRWRRGQIGADDQDDGAVTFAQFAAQTIEQFAFAGEPGHLFSLGIDELRVSMHTPLVFTPGPEESRGPDR